jgi:hypothetical protein
MLANILSVGAKHNTLLIYYSDLLLYCDGIRCQSHHGLDFVDLIDIRDQQNNLSLTSYDNAAFGGRTSKNQT